MKIRIITLITIAGVLITGCGKKQEISPGEMLEKVQNPTYIEHPVQKELGDENFNILLTQAKTGILLIYDYPDTVSDEDREELILQTYHPDSIENVYVRINQTLSSYGKSRVSVDKVQDVQKGTFKEMTGYKVYLQTRVRFGQKEESILFEVTLVETPENNLLVYWAEPAK